MKRLIYPIITLFLIIIILLIPSKKENSNLEKIKLAEVTHSIFYAPQYVAISEGYFKDEGLNIELILTPGADKVTSALLSGDVQIGFCGSETTLYVYNNGEKDYLINFAGLTKKDGSFIISREKIENFKIEDLENKHIIAGRKGGMPAMTLEYAIKNSKADFNKINFDTSYDFASTTGAFIGGEGDFVTQFEPTASSLVKEGYGYIVASVGELGKTVPYTSYIAKKSYIENNEETIKKFTKAINKGLEYVNNHTSREIAYSISSFFTDININELEKLIQNYKDIDAWFLNTTISLEDFNHIEDIVESSDQLKARVPYDILVKNY